MVVLANIIFEVGMKHNAEILMRILLNGAIVEHQGTLYAMNEDGALCWVESYDSEIGHKMDCDLQSFVKLANELSFDQLFLAGANVALQDINKKGRR